MDRSVLDFLDGPFTYLNERLAKYYGIPGVEGSRFRRVALTGNQRSGLLTQASILTISSYPTRTSPVIRGKWILENFLAAPPPPPPPNVPRTQDRRDRRTQLPCGSSWNSIARIPLALRATRGWTPSASRSRITTPSDSGARTTASSPSMRRAR
ncbi:MAG: DUF1588 domain-containing protein [Paludibaculum sp.]